MESKDNGDKKIFPKTIFLDSNALSRLSIYIGFCDTLELNMNDGPVDLGEKSLFWKKVRYPQRIFALEKGIKEGQRVYFYLKGELENGLEIVTSQVCEFELLHILAERKADLNLIRAGIPYRLRTKRIGKLFLYGWDEYDYNEITHDLERFRISLSHEGIEYDTLEDRDGIFKDIYKIAGVISKHILLGTGDIYIYASAILAESDELITYDSELCSISNNLKEPENEFWESIREKLLEDMKETLPRFSDSSEIILPYCKRV